MNRPAVEAGLAMLEAGGDFADGIMAYEGRWLGGETFVSFNKKRLNCYPAREWQRVCSSKIFTMAEKSTGIFLL